MINVTEEFKKNIKPTYAKVVCTYSDGNTDTFNKDIMQGDNNIIDESTSGIFPIGDSICKYVTVSLDNSNQKYSDKDFFNATLDYYLYQNKESGTTETIRKGTYTVSEAKYYDDLIEITALDDMWKADKEYKTNLPLPQPLLALTVEACDTCEILMGFSSLENNFVIKSLPEGISFRDFFGFAAMAQCANARIDVSNKLQFKKWDFESKPHNLKNYIQSPTLSSDDVIITGIKVSNDNNTYTYGQSGYELSLSNRLLNDEQCQEIAEYIYNCVGGCPFRTLDGQLMTDASIEFGDMAVSVDRYNNTYLTPITSVYYALNGITDVKTITEEPIRNASIYSPLAADAIVEARKLVAKEKTEREQAIEDLAGKIVSSTSGLYMTEQPQETGGSIYYMHNKETLEESDIIWKLTAEAFAISTDGGQTYPYGFVVDGELITRLLYAEGINADYINAGAFDVKDSNGNIVFQADVSTGKIIINTDNVKLNANGIMELFAAYISDKIKMRAFGDTIPPSYTDYVDAIYANTGAITYKNIDWKTWAPASSAIYGTLLLNIGSTEVPLKILANTEFQKPVLFDNTVYVDSDLFANRIGCNNLKVNNKEVITTGNIASQSVNYANSAESATKADYIKATTGQSMSFSYSGFSDVPTWMLGVADSNTTNIKLYTYKNQLNSKLNYNSHYFEMNIGSGVARPNFIDFHYDGGTSDYTQRIITFSASGNLTAYPGISNASDKRLKNDIEELDNVYIDIIKELKPVQYRYKHMPEQLRLGFIAQEVDNVLDKYAVIDKPLIEKITDMFAKDNKVDEAEYYALDYNQFIPMAIKAIQDLYSEIDKLKNQIRKGEIKNE